MIFIIDHIHHLTDESKILIFDYNSNRRMYTFYAEICVFNALNDELKEEKTTFSTSNYELIKKKIVISKYSK